MWRVLRTRDLSREFEGLRPVGGGDPGRHDRANPGPVGSAHANSAHSRIRETREMNVCMAIEKVHFYCNVKRKRRVAFGTRVALESRVFDGKQ